MGKTPKVLYKYRMWQDPSKKEQYQRKILTDNEIYLSSAEQFNDPFDCSLPFRYKETDLTPENLFNKLYEVGRIMWPNLTDNQLSIRNEIICTLSLIHISEPTRPY